MASFPHPRCAAADAMFTTQPLRRSRIGRAKACVTSIVPIRLLCVSAWMSSSATSSPLFGSGLVPVAPMSPPAQLTRMSTFPRSFAILRAISATASGSPMLPSTVATRPPWRPISRATSSRPLASPYFAGCPASRSWMATSAPSAASLSAIARPSPRPEPVTNAILPAKGLSVISLHESECTQVRGAAPHHLALVSDQLLAAGAALPRRPEVLVRAERVHLRGAQRRGELPGVHRRIALPPLLREEPDVARRQRTRLERGREVAPQDLRELPERHRALADGAADEPVALSGGLHPVVLEMHVPDPRGDGAGEVERRLRDRERVARVERDADGLAGLGAQLHELGAREVLVVLDGHAHARRGRAGGDVRQPRADAVDDPRPVGGVPVALEHRGERHADDRRAQRHGAVERGLVARRVAPTADDRDPAVEAPGERGRVESVQPRRVELDDPRADLAGDLQEAVEARARVALQAEGVREPVGVQPDGERHAICSSSAPEPVTDGPRFQRSVHSPAKSPRRRSPSRATSTAACSAPAASNSRTVRAAPSARPNTSNVGAVVSS